MCGYHPLKSKQIASSMQLSCLSCRSRIPATRGERAPSSGSGQSLQTSQKMLGFAGLVDSSGAFVLQCLWPKCLRDVSVKIMHEITTRIQSEFNYWPYHLSPHIRAQVLCSPPRTRVVSFSELTETIFPRIYARRHYAPPRARAMSFSNVIY